MKQLQANSGDSWRRNLSKPDLRGSAKSSSVTNRLSMIQKNNENKKFSDENKVGAGCALSISNLQSTTHLYTEIYIFQFTNFF